MGVLRFLLALAVLIQHSGPLFGLRLTGGIVAVQAFFIISGFYMTLILEEKYSHVARPYTLFMGNRLLRLFPTYLAVLVLTLAVYYVVASASGQRLGTPWGGVPAWEKHSAGMALGTRLWLWLTNLGLLGQDWTLFTQYDARHGMLHFAARPLHAPVPGYRFLIVPQAWTLGLELTFYAVAPFLVRRRWWIVASLLAASLALRWYDKAALHLVQDPWSYRFFPHELALFLAGCLGCKIYRSYMAQRSGTSLRRWGVVSLALVVAFTFAYHGLAWEWKRPIYLVVFALSIPLVFARTKSWRWDRQIGELSYPMYISHVLFVPYVRWWTARESALSPGLLLTAATLLLAAALHFGLERKVDQLRQRRIRREEIPTSPQTAATATT